VATKDQQQEEKRLESLHKRQRMALSDGYAELESEKHSKSASAFTFEEALDAQIQEIEGLSTKVRPNKLDRVEAIYNNVVDAVEHLKNIPPEQFLSEDEDRDVNTSEDGTDSMEQAVRDSLDRLSGSQS
jgi:hypothetical protein